jgi:hypothetical protein
MPASVELEMAKRMHADTMKLGRTPSDREQICIRIAERLANHIRFSE